MNKFIPSLMEFLVNRINTHESTLQRLENENKSFHCYEGIAAASCLDELYEIKDFIKRNILEPKL